MDTLLELMINCTMTEDYLFGLRYHFNKDCLVIQWSGDNPNSVAGVIFFP
jgi:hypothetical protein